MMNKAKIHFALEIVKYLAMILCIVFGISIFFSNNNFCVEPQGAVLLEHEGKRCFKTLSEAQEYMLMLDSQYNTNRNDLGIKFPFDTLD